MRSRSTSTSGLVAMLWLALSPVAPASELAFDDFESGLNRWALSDSEQIEIVAEPGTGNHVLRLSPARGRYVHAVLADSLDWQNVRFEGRFLFPTDGDGYLGFLYNLVQTSERLDFGCLYVKSNGSYVRVSPHHDGNPSWRLYEELRRDLEGDRQIRAGVWYLFRLDVRGSRAELSLGLRERDLEDPVVRFDGFPAVRGGLGLEARPRGGEPVWVDDVSVTKLDARERDARARGEPITESPPAGDAIAWEVLGPFSPGAGDPTDRPELPEEGWRAVRPDQRGAIVTGLETQFRSGEKTIVYLRTHLELAPGAAPPTWLGLSAANRIDVWFRGYFRGTVAPERFIWSDFATSAEHPGARVPVAPGDGPNELILRVDGENFAGGGFYAEWIVPAESRDG